ncbi:glycine cleavage system protein H [Pseudomonas azerbaijanoccidentalis]
MNFTGVFLFSKQHLWVREEAKTFYLVIGITRHGADQLGDIKYVDVSDVVMGDMFLRVDQVAFTIESVKSVLEYPSPISGSVVGVNENLINFPGKINEDPDNGWLLIINPEDRAQTSNLMTKTQYDEYLKTC